MVYEVIRTDPNITQKQIATVINVSHSSVSRIIKKLKTDGLIKRIGSDKTGYWEIIEKRS